MIDTAAGPVTVISLKLSPLDHLPRRADGGVTAGGGNPDGARGHT